MSASPAGGWDWWSEVKLGILKEYLHGFTTAVRGKSSEAIYLDLFTGSFDNPRRHGTGTFPGSGRLALEADPPFTKLAFFELPEPANDLEAAVRACRPQDRRWRVFPGDCNHTLGDALQWLEQVRWAPTFAFLDPRGLQVAWATIEKLAAWRADKRTKVEQWILLPEPALARVLGLQGVQGQRSAERLDRLYGSRSWLAIHELRRSGAISPEEMRAEFVNLLRWRLQRVLGYRTTHALQLVNTSGHPLYTMVFATDSGPGDRIMAHVYNSVATSTIPSMRERAQAARQQRAEDAQGLLRLPGMEEYETRLQRVDVGYDHVEPWEPPSTVNQLPELSGTLDVNPDEIDADRWIAEVDGDYDPR